MSLNSTFISALENIYISPTELCNLNCQYCYTHKTKNLLTNQQILSFVRRYQDFLKKFEGSFLTSIEPGDRLAARQKISENFKSENLRLKSILFCGGEVFMLKNFSRLVNKLSSIGIFVSIITNGTIDRLKEIKDPHNCQLLVSFDGPQNIHDQNRGKGNFARSSKFVKHALDLGFPVEIMFLVTPNSYPFIDTFDVQGLSLNYISQKTYFYTSNHPLSNQKNLKPALTPSQIINLKQNYRSLPPSNFGCFQLSLQSNGLLYGCCESPQPLGKISDKIPTVIKKFEASLTACQKCGRCGGCCLSQFLCGYLKELNLTKCTDVVKRFT